MTSVNTSVFLKAAEASQLLTPEQLHLAVVSACDSGDESRVSTKEVSDDAIGRRLIELGFLNSWQVEQLKAGRSKFSLGPYRILDAIGRGGMGYVFKAEHDLLGRVEAIKVLPKNKTTADTIKKFRHEIRTQAQLDHPNLVRVNYADQEGDTYFLVTEFVPGSDLRKLIRRLGPLSHHAASLIIQQASEGLEHAHRRGLVHRDIKPGNLLVTPDAVVKLIDLGLAWYLEEDIHAARRGDRLKIVGTADYLAPETIRDPGRIVPVSDVYSLGCTLYYAVTGKVPFPGGNPTDKMRRHMNEVPMSPDQLQPNLPPEFVDLISRMMSKDPLKRPPSAGAVANTLRQWATEEAIVEVSDAVRRVEQEVVNENHVSVDHGPLIDDTLEFDKEDDPFADFPNQASQGTDPISAATADTNNHVTSDFEPRDSEHSAQQPNGRDKRAIAGLVAAGLIGFAVVVWLLSGWLAG